MSADAWIEEHWIGEAVLPRPRRAPKLPALPVPHAPTCSRGNAALAAHAQSRDRARHPGDGLSSRQNGRNVVDQQARKLTQPPPVGLEQPLDIARGGDAGGERAFAGEFEPFLTVGAGQPQYAETGAHRLLGQEDL